MTHQIIKFSSGDEVVCDVIQDAGDYLTVENPMKMYLTPRVTKHGIVESLTLSKWLHPYTEQKVLKIRKDSIITIVSVSEGMKTFYRRQLEINQKEVLKINDWEARDYNDDMDEEEIKKFLDEQELPKSLKKKLLN